MRRVGPDSTRAWSARGQGWWGAADCAGCHAGRGGRACAGGVGMQTPVGTLYSTIITPDAATGIGAYD